MTLDLGHGDTPGIALLADMAPFHRNNPRVVCRLQYSWRCFKYFVAEIGLNHNSLNETKAVFKVLLDGRIVYESKAMSGDDDGVEVKIELKEAERLQLYVCDAVLLHVIQNSSIRFCEPQVFQELHSNR